MIWRVQKLLQSPDFGLIPPAKIINRVRLIPISRLIDEIIRAEEVHLQLQVFHAHRVMLLRRWWETSNTSGQR